MAGDRTPGLIRRKSAHDAGETGRRFRAAAQGAGLTIFAEVDHQKNAIEAGMALGPCLLLIFGAGRGGTPLIQADPTAGIDLPLKALIWTDADGATWFGWNDPHWIAERHGLGEGAQQAVVTMAAGLEKLGAAATS
jgi:uncharacterized protein (DUF302 family)